MLSIEHQELLLETAELKNNRWKDVAEYMNRKTGLNLTGEQWRRQHRTVKENEGKDPVYKMPSNEERLMKLIKKPIGVETLAKEMRIPEKVIQAYVDTFIEQGINISRQDGYVWIEKNVLDTYETFKEAYEGETELKFAIIADTHLCSKKQQMTHLNDFYDRCVEHGVKTVYHAGDISEGSGRRKGQIYEIFAHGVDDQADYIIEHFPKREGVTTKFIIGNHDAWHIENGGGDIGKRISAGRDDMEYLGSLSAKVWITPKCDIDIVHPLDGSSYALSYTGQKYIDALQGGSKPSILAIGHHHKAMFYEYRNIQVFESMCFQAQTDWEKGKRISVSVGGWIVTLKLKPNGEVIEITPKKIQYYIMNEKDY